MTIYRKPHLCLCLVLTIILFALILSKDLEVGQRANNDFSALTVEFQSFGLDSGEMEKLITEPFEKKIQALDGVFEIRSLAEYGKSVTTLYMFKSANVEDAYLEVSHIVDAFYDTLPDFVQKPQIYTSAVDQSPIFMVFLSSDTMDLSSLHDYAERTVKKKLEGVDGIAEVEISGGSGREVQVKFQGERLYAQGIDGNFLARSIQRGNLTENGGRIMSADKEIPIFFNTGIKNFTDFRKIPVKLGDNILNLGNICSVEMGGGDKDTFVRINGTEGIVLSVKAGDGGNSMKISRQCKEILKSMDLTSLEFAILKDKGEMAEKIIGKVVFSVTQSFFLVIFLLPLFFPSMKKIFLISGIIPFSVVCCGGVLAAFNFPIDQNVLSGVSVSLGLIVDGALVCGEISEQKGDFFHALKKEIPAIISSCATTIIAMIPLLFFDALSPGIFAVIISVITMLIFSTLVTTLFLPAFFPKKQVNGGKITLLNQKFTTKYEKFSSKIIDFSLENSHSMVVAYILMGCTMVVLLFLSPKSLAPRIEEENFSFRCEYDSEISSKKIDEEVLVFTKNLLSSDEIIFLQSTVQKGSGDFIVKFRSDKTEKEELWKKIQEKGSNLTGFLHSPDVIQKKSAQITQLEIAITGDDIKECCTLAKKSAAALSQSPFFSQTVLNFKDEETFYGFYPEKIKLVANQLTVTALADALRLLFFAPVISKWNDTDGEKDIRLYEANLYRPTSEKLNNINIFSPNGPIPLKSLGELKENKTVGKIYRKNGRHCAYLTTNVSVNGTEKAMNKVSRVLEKVDFPKGYRFEFSHSVETMKENILILIAVFGLCLVFLLILLVAINEEILSSLITISIIPVSLFPPMMVKFFCGMPITGGDVAGMVMVSGIAVNNAIYIFDIKKHSAVCNVKGLFFARLKSIYATSLTGIVGALPLMVFSEESFIHSVGFFMFWGNLGSVLITIFCLPAVIHKIIGCSK